MTTLLSNFNFKYTLLVLPIIMPAFLYNFAIVKFSCYIGSAVACIWIFYNLAKYRKICLQTFLLCVLYMLFAISTCGNENTSMLRYLIATVPVLISVLLLDISYRKNELFRYLITLLLLLSIFNILNFFSILLYPSGLYSPLEAGMIGTTIFSIPTTAHYFLGFTKGHLMTHVFVCSLAVILGNYYKEDIKIVFYLNLCVSILSNIIVLSVSSLFGLLLFIIAENKCFYRLYNMVSMVKIYYALLLVWIGIVVFRIHEYFADLFVLLGKDITLTGRTVLWDVGMDKIMDSPLFGIGIISTDKAFELFHYGVASVHSLFLEIFFYGGFVSGVIFLVICHKSSRSVDLLKYNNYKLSYCFKIIITSLLIILLVNSPQRKEVFYFMVVLPSYINLYLNKTVTL